VNNSQSIERFSKYCKVIDGCELSADQCKAALLADGLISPKTTFFSNNRKINPEIAGYGVLPCSQVREVVQTARGIDQERLFPTSTLEREQPGLAADRMQIEGSSTPPAQRERTTSTSLASRGSSVKTVTRYRPGSTSASTTWARRVSDNWSRPWSRSMDPSHRGSPAAAWGL